MEFHVKSSRRWDGPVRARVCPFLKPYARSSHSSPDIDPLIPPPLPSWLCQLFRRLWTVIRSYSRVAPLEHAPSVYKYACQPTRGLNRMFLLYVRLFALRIVILCIEM